MVPVVEMATCPRSLHEPLMLHEPGVPRSSEHRTTREETIARIVAKPGYPRARTFVERAKAIPVLCYHRVLPRTDSPLDAIYRSRGMVVDVDVFEAQLRALRQRFEPLTLEEFQQAVTGQRGLPRRGILVTFDDGYADFAQHAMPLLERLGVPSVLFARRPCDDGLPQWAPLDVLYAVLSMRGHVEPAELIELRRQTMAQPAPFQREFVFGLARRFDVNLAQAQDWRRHLYLDLASVKNRLDSSGVDLGSHGDAHVRGDTMSAVAAERDYSLALEALQASARSTGSPLAMAYPDGDTCAAEAAARVGFDLGFGLQVPWHDVTPHRLRRALVPNTTDAIDTIGRDWSAS